MTIANTTTKSLLLRPIDGFWLALYRIGLGACLLWQIWKYFSADLINSYYIAPTHHFSWFGLEFIQPWNAWNGLAMYAHFAVLGVAAMCILLGYRYRIACVVFFIGYTWVFLMDVCWYLNHYYLICLLSFLAIFLPANRELSIDALRNPDLRRTWTPIWTRRLLQFQIALPYVYGGIAKLNSDWLHGEPMRSWMAEQSNFPLIGPYFRDEWCVNLFVYGGLVLDLGIVPLLLWKRTRPFAIVAAIMFHLLNFRLFTIGVFPWLMIIVTITLFTDPDMIARLRFIGRPADPTSAESNSARLSPVWTTVLGIYVALQILMPLRHHFYPGHTAFTDEGHPFSWRMKLNNRFVDARFYHVDATTGARHPLPLHHWISYFQERKLEDADQLLQLARWMEDDLIAKGVPDPVITVDVTVALNGRPPTRFADPKLDLTTVQRSLEYPDWITLEPVPTHLSELPALELPPTDRSHRTPSLGNEP